MRKKQIFMMLMAIGLVCILSSLIVTSAGCPPAEPVSTALPTVTVDCGYSGEIYKNNTASSINVTVQATDKCQSHDSSLEVRDKDEKKLSEYRIRDGGTGTTTFSVPAGGIINFQCLGEEGDCSYTISVD